MQTYISFLRGVNMTGHNSIKMKDLSELYISLGLNDSETYIQSGNVISRCNADILVASLSDKIEAAILERFNYTIPVMIRTVPEVKDLFSSNPFLTEDDFQPSKMAVIFLHKKPSDAQIQKVVDIDYPPTNLKSLAGKFLFIVLMVLGRQSFILTFSKRKLVSPVLQETGRQ